MKTPAFKLSSLLILPAALLLESVPIRATESEDVVPIPVSAALLLQSVPAQAVEPETAPLLIIAADSKVPPSPLVEWFGLSETSAEEQPATICDLEPPPAPGDDGGLLAVELPPLFVESPPLPPFPAADWPENIIEAQDHSRGLGIALLPALDFPLRESAQEWLASTRR